MTPDMQAIQKLRCSGCGGLTGAPVTVLDDGYRASVRVGDIAAMLARLGWTTTADGSWLCSACRRAAGRLPVPAQRASLLERPVTSWRG